MSKEPNKHLSKLKDMFALVFQYIWKEKPQIPHRQLVKNVDTQMNQQNQNCNDVRKISLRSTKQLKFESKSSNLFTQSKQKHKRSHTTQKFLHQCNYPQNDFVKQKTSLDAQSQNSKDQVQQINTFENNGFIKPYVTQYKLFIKNASESEIESKTSQSKSKSEQSDQKTGQNSKQKAYQTDIMEAKKGSQDQQQSSFLDDFAGNIRTQQNVMTKFDEVLKFAESNPKIIQLQDKLHEFKARFFTLPVKIQIKWRILMADCKQKRKLFFRACILYQQILQFCQNKFDLLPICKGFLYTENQEWNKGIDSFKHALQAFKSDRKQREYANALNNLGRLYLLAGKLSEAEQCLLICYRLKYNIYGLYSPHLLSTVNNIFQCNVLVRNSIQAEIMIQIMQRIAKTITQNQCIDSCIQRKRAKLALMFGDLKHAQSKLQLSEKQLKKSDQLSYKKTIQFAEIMNLKGLLCIQQQKYYQAKQSFQSALNIYRGYYCKENKIIKTTKFNLQLAQNFLFKNQTWLKQLIALSF